MRGCFLVHKKKVTLTWRSSCLMASEWSFLCGLSVQSKSVCLFFFFPQATVTPRRAAPSSTAVMLPQRRASSMTARTWPCLRYARLLCTQSGMIVRSRIHSYSQFNDWIGSETSINEGNYWVKGTWELQVNASKPHTATEKNFSEAICHQSAQVCLHCALSVGWRKQNQKISYLLLKHLVFFVFFCTRL